jgi:hypothetical protein
LRRLIAVALLGLACASPGMPPGGPPDVAAPELVSITPDSGTVGTRPKEVIFLFDEVVTERPPSVTNLADLFLISPRNGATSASWHREAVSVKPARGWQPNTAYTVIMQKGIADIRGNVRNTGATTFFSTGRAIPQTRIAGVAFDWASGSPAGGALVESFVPPDSVHAYIAVADSNGAFLMEHMPAARYVVRAYVDRNKNQGIDVSEQWDSTSVALGDSSRATLFLFVHDTLPPRIRDVRTSDSVTIHLTFDKPIDPAQTVSATNFAVIGPDSLPIPIISAGPPARDTAPSAGAPAGAAGAPVTVVPVVPPVASATPAAAVPPAAQLPVAARGNIRPGVPTRDTTVVAKPVMPRPVPPTEIIIKLQRPLAPKVAYRIRAIGIRNLLGRTGDSERVYTMPAPTPIAPKPATPPPVKQ